MKSKKTSVPAQIQPSEAELTSRLSEDQSQPIEALRERFYDDVVNLQTQNFLDLDADLLTDGSEEATKLRVTLWSTVIDIAEKRRTHALKMLESSTEVSLSSYYISESMPYGRHFGYEVEQRSFPNAILSLPYGDPEHIFQWSKLIKHSHLFVDQPHPRVVIEMQDDEVVVSSDQPVQFFIVGPSIKIPEGVDKKAWIDDLNKRVKETCDRIIQAHPEHSDMQKYVKPLQEREGYAVCEPFALLPPNCRKVTT